MEFEKMILTVREIAKGLDPTKRFFLDAICEHVQEISHRNAALNIMLLQEKSNVAMKNDKILELEGIISQLSSELASLNARTNSAPVLMPMGAMTYAIACALCKNKDSALCEKCICEVKSGFESDPKMIIVKREEPQIIKRTYSFDRANNRIIFSAVWRWNGTDFYANHDVSLSELELQDYFMLEEKV